MRHCGEDKVDGAAADDWVADASGAAEEKGSLGSELRDEDQHLGQSC